MSSSHPRDLLTTAVRAALLGGEAILTVYHLDDREITFKEDSSPLTLADRRADEAIRRELAATGIPILTEESSDIPYRERKEWQRFWLVDPLDGTKEFIRRNDEFTVNIALIEAGEPVAGVVYLPVFRQLYFAVKGEGAYRLDNVDIHNTPSFSPGAPLPEGAVRLPDRQPAGRVRVVVSRSHLSPETEAFIRRTLGDTPYETLPAGSSLKFCRVAEGVADLYPRMGPTMEWDIAAATLLVTESGGSVSHTDGTPLRFNKEDLHNPWFVVANKKMTERIRKNRES